MRLHQIWSASLGLGVVSLLVLLGGGWYFSHQLAGLNRATAQLTERVALLEGNLASTSAVLTATQGALTETQRGLADATSKVSSFQKKVTAVSGSVKTLEKLSQTDPELLQKYSKIFFLNEHYAPAELVAIPEEDSYSSSKTLKFSASAWPFLHKLLDAAKDDGIKLYVDSAYRSFNEQSALKSQYKVTYGAGTANSFSADQGYSEHQLGTTVDFISTGQGGQLEGFDKTAAYAWLQTNAYKYGFILSYPANNQYYVFEPWHWRFVGRKLAGDLHDDGENFDDLDQREIDKYLVSIFD